MPLKDHPLQSTIKKIFEKSASKQEYANRFLEVQRMAGIGHFAASIAHNLKNVMGGILGYSQLMKEELEPDSDFFRQIEQIEKASRRASEILTRLLFFSNRQQGLQKVIDPGTVLDEVVNILNNNTKRNIKIHTKVNHQAARIYADSILISQALLNVCLNSFDAMPYGGHLRLDLDVATDAEAQQQSYVRFKISDTGVGIPDEVLSRVFEPFFTTKEIGKGAGLGLTIVDGIVKEHKGNIAISSKVNEGTTVELAFPVTTRQVYESHSDPTDDLIGDGDLILVVDDEEDLRLMAKKIFEKKGYRVLLAHDGKSAIQTFRRHATEIRLVILDLIMPGLDGFQIYQELKASGDRLKIILTSGYPKNTSIENLIKQGVESFIPKPWEINELLEETKRVLRDT